MFNTLWKPWKIYQMKTLKKVIIIRITGFLKALNKIFVLDISMQLTARVPDIVTAS